MNLRLLLFSFILLDAISSCGQPKFEKPNIEKAMQDYDRHIISMNLDSIASSYMENGDLSDIAHGRDSIRKFLSRFASFKVLSQRSTSESLYIDHDTALQTGRYKQTVIISPGDTVSVTGFFTTRWEKQNDEKWLIKRIDTRPAK